MRQQFIKILYCFSFAIILMATLPTIAQNKGLLVRGQVVDASDNLPIPGATIVEQDAENRTVTGVITDIDGNFVIRVKDPNHKLNVCTIGYKTKVVQINGRETIKISLVSTIIQSFLVLMVLKNSSMIYLLEKMDFTHKVVGVV